ncbi:MAG TPA: hypothetical protein VF462_05310 [Micromonosporaceae bacterium]
MTVTASPTRQSRTPQRAGHLVGALVNAALFYAVNAWPSWAALPFLTNDTVDVLPLVNASILAGLVANLLYVFADYAWLTSLGEILSTAVGLAALVQVWRVFPFDFDPTPVDWARVVRVVLVVAMIGSGIGMLAQTVSLFRGGTRS